MSDERATLEVGRIVKAHGLRGQVLVDLWSDRVERLAVGSDALERPGSSGGAGGRARTRRVSS